MKRELDSQHLHYGNLGNISKINFREMKQRHKGYREIIILVLDSE